MPTIRRTRHHIGRDTRLFQTRLAAAERTIQARQREIATLHRITGLALSEQPLRELLQTVVQDVSACTGFPIVVIEFYHQAEQVMEFVAATGIPLPSDSFGLRIPVGQTLSGLVAQNGQFVIERQALGRPDYLDLALRHARAQTVLSLPLAMSGRVIGTLSLAHPQVVPVDADLLALAESLANLIATLIARQVVLTKYRTLFDLFPLGITVSDATGAIVESNAMAEQLLGIGSEEQRQRTIDGAEWRIVRADGSPMPASEYASVRALIEQRSVENVEMGVIRPSGETTWINVTAAPLPLDAYGVVITYSDITQRRQTEALVAAQRDLARIPATISDPEVVWARCLAHAVQVTGMDSGGIYLLDAAEQNLELITHQGLGEAFIQATAHYPRDAPGAQLVLAGESLYMPSSMLGALGFAVVESVTCLASMPIRYQGKVLGCINLASHTLPQVPPFARQALETIGTEIGNIVVALRTAATLRESQFHMELAISGANLGTWDWELQTGRTVFNQRWAEIVGYTLAELEPVSIQTWIDLCHPDDIQRSEVLLQQHMSGASAFYECELRMRHKGGDWIWVFDRGKVVEWADGTPVRMAGTHLDITARKHAELALRLSEEQYRGLMESLDNLVVTIDASGRFHYLNQVAARRFGGRAQEFVGKTLYELFSAEESSDLMSFIRIAIGEDKHVIVERRMQFHDKSRWYRTSIQPIHDEQGHVIYVLVTATDIHDLEIAQQKLLELNRTLEERVHQRTAEVQDLYDHAPVGYHSLDRNGCIVRINQTELDWLGYSREELIGQPLTYVVIPEHQARFPVNFALLQQQGSVWDVELELVRKDGSTFPVLISATAILDETGAFVMSRSTMTDITRRKQAEMALRESEERFRRLAENAPDAIFRFDYLPERHFAYVSAAITTITGYSPDDYYADPDLGWRLLHVEDQPRFQAYLSDLTNLRNPIEMRWHHRNGTLAWVEQRNVPIVDATGQLIAIEGIIRDITERKYVSEALRASEARLQLLLSNTPAVIFTAWAEPDYRTTFISDTVQVVLGHAPASYLESSTFWTNQIHPEDKRALRHVEVALQESGSLLTEYRCRHADGSYRWIENGLRLLPAVPGRPREMIGYMIDVTERKQAEEILRQANLDMAHAARMKDEFLANMSHELRSPLNAILGFSENLQEEIYGSLSKRQQGAISYIESSARHLLALITDILDLSKVEAGRLSLAIEPVIIAEVCQASLLFIKDLALKKAVTLALQLNDPLVEMEVDPLRLKQMLVNLLSNAVKFTPSGGHVRLDVTINVAANLVRFAVHDTGIGIAPEELTRLFQPFVQLDSSLNRQHAGTGLGLALVRRLAELHSGHVTVESTPGLGSCFTLVLPLQGGLRGSAQLRMAASAEAAAAHGPIGQPTSAHILLVEDNEATIRMLSEHLRAGAFTVTVARRGWEVLAMAVEQQPDLILMDIQLSSMDGLEVMRRLRALPAMAATPLIALIALVVPGERERCLEAGANAFLSKPIKLHELQELIKRLLER